MKFWQGFCLTLQIILMIAISPVFCRLENGEASPAPISRAEEVSLSPIVFFSSDINNDRVADIIWGSKDILLAFKGDLPFLGDPRDLIWANTSIISNAEMAAVVESQGKQQSLVMANSTAIGLIRLQDGFQVKTISLSPKTLSRVAAGFFDSNKDPDIVIATKDGDLICMESPNKIFWNQSNLGTISALTVSNVNGDCCDDVIAASGTNVMAINGSDGDILGNWSSSSDINHIIRGTTNGAQLQQNVVVLEASGSATAYNIASPTPLWWQMIRPNANWVGGIYLSDGSTNSDLVVATRDGWISRRNGSSGVEIWMRNLQANITGIPILIDTTDTNTLNLVIPSREKGIFVLNGEDGTDKRRFIPAKGSAIMLAMSGDCNNDSIPDYGGADSNGLVVSIDYLNGLPIWYFNISILLHKSDEEPTSGPISSTSNEEPASPSDSSMTDRDDSMSLTAFSTLAISFVAILTILGVRRWFRKQ